MSDTKKCTIEDKKEQIETIRHFMQTAHSPEQYKQYNVTYLRLLSELAAMEELEKINKESVVTPLLTQKVF